MKSKTEKEALALDGRKVFINFIIRGREAKYMGTTLGRLVDLVGKKQNKINKG